MSELVFTAYDVNSYLREALPALKAAIFRADLSKAKDVLQVYEDTLYDEWALADALVDGDYGWIFTEEAVNADELDPDGTMIGLTYPLILVYHHPDLLRVVIGGSELTRLDSLLPFVQVVSSAELQSFELKPAAPDRVAVLPGFREGLRAMWEIIGFVSPEGTVKLRDNCLRYLEGAEATRERRLPLGANRILRRLADGLLPVIERGFGLVIERD